MGKHQSLIVIVGINGRQGSSVARSLINKPEQYKLRGITSDIDSMQSHCWQVQGVDMRQIDYRDNTASFKKAFKGAHYIFVVANFDRYLDEQLTVSLAESMMKKHPEEIPAAWERLEGKAIATAAAKVKSLKHLVITSPSPAYGDIGNIRGLQQFHSKAKIVEYLAANFPELSEKTSLILPALYMEDWQKFLRLEEDGRYKFGTTLPANVGIPWTHIAKDMGTLFRICMVTPHRLKLAGISTALTGNEVCRLVRDATGIRCDYVQYTPAELVSQLGDRGHIMVDMLDQIERGRYFAHPGFLLPWKILEVRDDAGTFKFTYLREQMEAELRKSEANEPGTGN